LPINKKAPQMQGIGRMTFGVIWVSAHPSKCFLEVLLVFEATNREAVRLTEGVPGDS